jgi:hypothetical protein
MTILLMTCLLAFSLGCSRDEAEDAVESAQDSAHDMMDHASDTAGSMADQMADQATTAAAGVAGDAVAACRRLAESGAWEEALEVCQKAHEMMPDDLALEHAYQQAQAAAAN